nr:hypothetical protein GCM10020241_05060 [Streptoalloteichus tenebrarius]
MDRAGGGGDPWRDITPPSVLRMTLWEGMGIATGVAMGTAAFVVSVSGLWWMLRDVGLTISLTLPWVRCSPSSRAIWL